MRRQESKKTRLSPSAEEKEDSSATSIASVSEDSALRSSPSASRGTRHEKLSSVSSISEHASASSASDLSDISDVSEISDISEVSSESGSGDEIIAIGGPKKPNMTRTGISEGAQDLRARLSALLPRLAESNEALSHEGGGLGIEDVDEDEQHIEMNLGLGVLEEKYQSDGDGDDQPGNDPSQSSDGEIDRIDGEDVPVSPGAVKRSPQRRHIDAMSKLKGQKNASKRPGIEEVG